MTRVSERGFDHLTLVQGYMYVEAFKESHVMEAIRGLRNVLISKGAKLVPLQEMVEAITVNTRAKKTIGTQSASSELKVFLQAST